MEKYKCKKCLIDKTSGEFTSSSRKKNKLDSTCKKCRAEVVRCKYNSTLDQSRQKKIKANDIRHIRNRKYILNYLKTHPCIDCGETDFIVLEFDHRENKKYNISNLVGRAGIKLIQEEINKCDVRCANCHRRKTAKQFNWYNKIES